MALGLCALLPSVAPAAAPRPAPVAVSERWRINNISQGVVIRGASASNPVLIWVSDLLCEAPLLRKHQAGLERDFTVVYWCPRYSGASFDPLAAKPAKLTFDDYVGDLDSLVDQVSHRLNVRRVVLVGHSSGTITALKYVAAHPDKVAAYVGVGQVVDNPEGLRRSYAWALETARARGDAAAISELTAAGAPPYANPSGEGVARKWIIAFGGAFHNGMSYGGLAREAVFSGYASWRDLAAALLADGYTAPLLHEQETMRFVGQGARYEVPIYLVMGRYDRRTDPALAKAWVEAIAAPDKAFVSFPRSAHSPPFEEPAAFRAWLVDRVRPGVVARP